MLKKLIALLEEASGLPKSALASFVKEDGTVNTEAITDDKLKEVREAFAAKVKTVGEDAVSKAQLTFDNGYKKAQGEVLDKYEDQLRAEVGIEEKVRGKQLSELLKAKLQAPKTEDLDKNAIEKNKFHLDEIERVTREYQAKLKAENEKYANFEAQVNEEKTFDKVWQAALPIIEESNPAFNTDSESVKAFQWNAIKEGIRNDRRFEVQGDRIVVLDKDGKVMKNEVGNPIDFKSLVIETVSTRVGTLKSERRESAGAKAGEKTNGAAYKGKPITNEDELIAVLSDPKLSYEEKQAAQEQYQAK